MLSCGESANIRHRTKKSLLDKSLIRKIFEFRLQPQLQSKIEQSGGRQMIIMVRDIMHPTERRREKRKMESSINIIILYYIIDIYII